MYPSDTAEEDRIVRLCALDVGDYFTFKTDMMQCSASWETNNVF